MGTFSALQILYTLWYQLVPYETFWAEAFLFANNFPGEWGVTVQMRLSMMPSRWFTRRTESIGNKWRLYYEYWLLCIPALWTFAHGLNLRDWTMLTRGNAPGPMYPTMASRRDGTVQEAIMEQQQESMISRGPSVPMEFARYVMGVYAEPYDDQAASGSAL